MFIKTKCVRYKSSYITHTVACTIICRDFHIFCKHAACS
jgi:hypothetical protein